ncbi:MAG: ABC-three component system protein [Pseudomonadota bacterium]|nr:ABC-three component system protein [Pseudomonadota bacterium]
MSTPNTYNASPSLAGYLFQCRLALLIGLRMVKKRANGHISIEKFDDVSFDNDNFAQCLWQAKHHISPKSLDDKSVDVWKTLRIWIDQFRQGYLSVADARFILITTATASDGTALSMLRSDATESSRQAARDLLIKAAKESINQKTAIGRQTFLSLEKVEMDALLERVEIIDQHSNLHDVMSEIESELILLSPQHVASLASRLEGWWLGVVGKCLVEEGSATIPIQNIIIKANEIGSMFKEDALPVDDPEMLGAKEYSMGEESNIFVKQMRIVDLKDNVIHRGVRDYYRATAQRSKWLRESLLLDNESSQYDAKLKDLYERQYDSDFEEYSPQDEEEKRKFGRRLCLWASQQNLDFRNVVETWITAGSFHSLSERMDIGWHPDYLDILTSKDGESND